MGQLLMIELAGWRRGYKTISFGLVFEAVHLHKQSQTTAWYPENYGKLDFERIHVC
jgi:hypothetical protein